MIKGQNTIAEHKALTAFIPASQVIPPMTDPLGKHWDQPNLIAIEIGLKHARMRQKAFDQLAEYSASIPTGKYLGKMWKVHSHDGKWYLKWYDKDPNPNYLSIPAREIIIVND